MTLIIESSRLESGIGKVKPGPGTQLNFFFVCFKAVKSGVGYLIIFKFILVTLFDWNTLVFLAKWFGNVLITWARVCFFVLSCRRISCYYLWCCLGFSWMSVLGQLLLGMTMVHVVGTCSVFDYQVVWGIYNCCMFWYFTHLG